MINIILDSSAIYDLGHTQVSCDWGNTPCHLYISELSYGILKKDDPEIISRIEMQLAHKPQLQLLRDSLQSGERFLELVSLGDYSTMDCAVIAEAEHYGFSLGTCDPVTEHLVTQQSPLQVILGTRE